MELVLICAVGRNREIGRKGGLIWRISDDLKRFKKITMGHPVIMGRKTYESIGFALPGRTNIIVTRQDGYSARGCVTAGSIDRALEKAGESEGGQQVFVIGGGELYAALIGKASCLALTVIEDEAADADTWFPEYRDDFVITHEEGPFMAGELEYRFVDLVRKSR